MNMCRYRREYKNLVFCTWMIKCCSYSVSSSYSKDEGHQWREWVSQDCVSGTVSVVSIFVVENTAKMVTIPARILSIKLCWAVKVVEFWSESFDWVESFVVSHKERSSPAGKMDCKHFGTSENCRQAMRNIWRAEDAHNRDCIKRNGGFLIIDPLTVFLVKTETRNLESISRREKIFLW
jgi:hypothetical protein